MDEEMQISDDYRGHQASDTLPLGAQHQQHNNEEQEDEEKHHFQQVCQSYQQYATFHQTRLQGIIHRVHKLLLSSRSDYESKANNYHELSRDTLSSMRGPTIESILPPTILPQTSQSQHQNKQFFEATIRNQFFLDNVLKYSGASNILLFLQKMVYVHPT